MKYCLFYCAFTGCISCILLCYFSKFATAFFLHAKISELSLQVLACSLPFVTFASCINGYFAGILQVKKSVYYQFSQEFLKICFVIILLLFIFPPNSIEHACISLAIGATLAEFFSFVFLFFLFFKEKNLILKSSHDPISNVNFTKQILKIAIPISFTSYIRSGLSSLKQVLIPIELEKFGVSCEVALSNYGIINGMVFPLIMFPCVFISSFSSLLIPEFSYMNAKQELRNINFALNRILKYCFLFSFLVFGFLFCFANELNFFVYPTTDLSIYIRFLSPLVVLMYVDNVVDSILKGLDKQVSVMGINIIDLITTISLICFLLPYKGIIGYIITLYISEILNGVLSFVLLIRETKFKLDFFNLLIKPLFIIIFLNYIFSKFKCCMTLVNFILYSFIFIFLYFILLFLLNSVKKNDLKF